MTRNEPVAETRVPSSLYVGAAFACELKWYESVETHEEAVVPIACQVIDEPLSVIDLRFCVLTNVSYVVMFVLVPVAVAVAEAVQLVIITSRIVAEAQPPGYRRDFQGCGGIRYGNRE